MCVCVCVCVCVNQDCIDTESTMHGVRQFLM